MTESQKNPEKPDLTLKFDNIVEFTLRAEANPNISPRSAKPRPANAPDLSLKMDEVTAFTEKAIPSLSTDKSESGVPVQEPPHPPEK